MKYFLGILFVLILFNLNPLQAKVITRKVFYEIDNSPIQGALIYYKRRVNPKSPTNSQAYPEFQNFLGVLRFN